MIGSLRISKINDTYVAKRLLATCSYHPRLSAIARDCVCCLSSAEKVGADCKLQAAKASSLRRQPRLDSARSGQRRPLSLSMAASLQPNCEIKS